MAIDALLSRIVEQMQSWLGEASHCKSLPGRLDPEHVAALKELVQSSPAIYVACLGVPSQTYSGSGQQDAQLRIAAYVIATDPERHSAALNRVETLLPRLPGERWGLSQVGPVETIKAENLWNWDLEEAGIAVWMVSWEQTLRLGVDAWQAEGAAPDRVFLGHSPRIGEPHVSDYIEVSGKR